LEWAALVGRTRAYELKAQSTLAPLPVGGEPRLCLFFLVDDAPECVVNEPPVLDDG